MKNNPLSDLPDSAKAALLRIGRRIGEGYEGQAAQRGKVVGTQAHRHPKAISSLAAPGIDPSTLRHAQYVTDPR